MPYDADDDLRVFRRSDPDFPITRVVQRRLVDAGRVEGEGPRAQASSMTARPPAASAGPRLAAPDGPCVPLGETDAGTLHLDLDRLLAGRLLIQGSSGAGRSATLRHLVEEAHDYLPVMVVDP